MSDKSHIAKGFLVATIAYDLVVSHRNKRKYSTLLERHIEDVDDYNELVDRFNTLKEEFESSQARSNYLASMLDEHEIDLDEFDLIALTNPI